MEIKNLTYKQIALIRKAILEKREKLWQDNIVTPFKKQLQKKSLKEVKEIKNSFVNTTNQFSEQGVCNIILNNLEKIEDDIRKEFENGK